ncbi:MAG: hypothetical protein ABI132_12320 [Rhodanobacteraceae bacterium]
MTIVIVTIVMLTAGAVLILTDDRDGRISTRLNPPPGEGGPCVNAFRDALDFSEAVW